MHVAHVEAGAVTEVRELTAYRPELARQGWLPVEDSGTGERERFEVLPDRVIRHRYDLAVCDAAHPTADLGPLQQRVEALEHALVIAAQGLASTQTEVIDLAQRLATIEGAMRALAVEAERNLRVA